MKQEEMRLPGRSPARQPRFAAQRERRRVYPAPRHFPQGFEPGGKYKMKGNIK
jgi:hypothetical protein